MTNVQQCKITQGSIILLFREFSSGKRIQKKKKKKRKIEGKKKKEEKKKKEREKKEKVEKKGKEKKEKGEKKSEKRGKGKKKHNCITVLTHHESGEGNSNDTSFLLFLNSDT